MEFKSKQKVWYYDHQWRQIKTGTLISTEDQSSGDELPTFNIRADEFAGIRTTRRVLQAWVFASKSEAAKEFKHIIRNKIRQLRTEIDALEALLD